MKKAHHWLYVILLAFIIPSGILRSQVTIPFNSPCGNADFEPFYSDEFNDINEAKWVFMDNFDHYGSLTCNLARNITLLPSGILKLDIVKEQYLCLDPNYINEWWCKNQWLNQNDPNFRYEYTGSWIETICPYNISYGYYEARINFPSDYGLHSAFWTVSSECGPKANAAEIDITEPVTTIPEKQWLQTNIHLCYPNSDPNCYDPDRYNSVSTGYNLLDNFQTYGLLYTPTTLQFYVNGICYRTEPNPGISDPIKIILGIGVESTALPLPGFQSASMYVDYLRVFRLRENTTWVEKKPYIINPTDDLLNSGKKQIDLMWQLPTGTPNSNVCTINWGQTLSYGNSTTVNDNGIDHLYRYTINNLNPSTRYYYNVISPICNYSGNFISPPANSSSTVEFYATGGKIVDNFDPSSIVQTDEIHQQILNEISNSPQSQTFIIQNTGFVTSDNYQYWRDEFFKYTIFSYQLKTRLAFVGGISSGERVTCLNALDDSHIEFATPGIGQNFRNYLPFNYANPYLNSNQDFEYNHSMDYGPVHICFPELEYKNTPSNDHAMTYIDFDLGNTTKEWKVMSFGFPLKSLNGEIMDEYAMILQKAKINGVQLVLMGGENYYAHWVEDGIHFLILGNGGSTTNGIDDQKIGNDNQLVCASTVPHFAKIKIEDNLMFVDIIQGADYNGTTKGRIIEKFAIPKRCYITSTQEWNSGTYPVITDFVWVATGGNLKVESEVQLLKDASIKVSRGAVLNLTGANVKLTSLSSFTEYLDMVTKDSQGNVTNAYTSNYTSQKAMWRGIEVNSYPPLNQLNFCNQGVLYVTNGAAIENAKVGVAIKQGMQVNGQNVWKGGGIIRAENATFRNCQTAVQMYPFRNNGSNYATSIDQSYFRNCTFVTDDDYLLKGVTSPTHMDLNGIYQLRVQGCTFRNDETPPVPSYLYHSLNGTGIMALDASVVVTPLCTTQTVPCGGQIRNQFINLHNAIHITQPLTSQGYSTLIKEADFTGNYRAVYANSPQLLQVKQCSLVNNYRGVYLLNSQGAMVEGNHVEIAEAYETSALGYPYGLYLDAGHGFSVEGNNFSSAYPGTASYGILVNNTGAKNNEIYRNTFTGLKVGIQPQFRNKGKINNEDLGLCLFCNEFDNPDTWDIWVAGKASAVRKKNIGINVSQQIRTWNSSTNQWDPYPAGNLFSPGHLLLPQNPSADNDFSNFDADPLTYAYDPQATTGRMEPVIYSNISIYPLQSGTTQCIPKTGSIQSLSQAYASMGSAQVAFNSSKLILDIYRNNGIPDLGEQVETTQPWEVYQEFNNLMSISPYVDADVVLAMVQNDVFTSLMVKLVCVANPQSARNDAVLEALYNRIPPMPEQYMEEILDESGSYSPLDELIGNTAADLHLVRTVGDEIIRMYLADTTNTWISDSLNAFLSRRPGLEDRYVYALHCMRNGQTDTAQTILAEISSGFTLTERELIEHESYVDVFDMLADIGANDLQPGDLTPEQTETLMLMLESEGTVEKSMAIALLKWNDPELEYNEPILEPIYYQARKARPASLLDQTKLQLTLYPNPAYDYVTVRYNLPNSTSQSIAIVVTDAMGRETINKALQSVSGELILDIRHLAKGAYTVCLKEGNQLKANQKLIIVK